MASDVFNRPPSTRPSLPAFSSAALTPVLERRYTTDPRYTTEPTERIGTAVFNLRAFEQRSRRASAGNSTNAWSQVLASVSRSMTWPSVRAGGRPDTQALCRTLTQAALDGDAKVFLLAADRLPKAEFARHCELDGLMLQVFRTRSALCNCDAEDELMVGKMLASGVSLDIENEYGETPLHLAVRQHPRTLALLCQALPPGELARGGRFTHTLGGLSPLHFAAKYDRWEGARVLLEYGANPWQLSAHGSPRQLALKYGAHDFVRMLDDWIERRRQTQGGSLEQAKVARMLDLERRGAPASPSWTPWAVSSRNTSATGFVGSSG
jgi:hypothetical protein